MPGNAIPGWEFLRELFRGDEAQIGKTRTREDIPYLITPRRGAILDAQPQIIWNLVLPNTSYTVILRGKDFLWETTVTGNTTTYTGTDPLVPGEFYTITITTATAETSPHGEEAISSALEGVSPNRYFYLLSEAERERLDTELAAIATDTGLSSVEVAVTRATLYQEYNLLSDAIAHLEDAWNKGETSLALYRLLGELYMQVELNRHAEPAFTELRTLALALGDRQAQADANSFLAYLLLDVRNPDEARQLQAKQLLEEAEQLYRELGDDAKVQAITELLTDF